MTWLKKATSLVKKGVKTGSNLAGKVVEGGTRVSSIVLSPNPVKAAYTALSGGAASQKKSESVNSANTKQAEKSRTISYKPDGSEVSTGNFFTRDYMLLKITLPIWVWFLILAAALFLLWKVFKHIFRRKTVRRSVRRSSVSSPRRRTGSASMKARMAKVRAARRKK